MEPMMGSIEEVKRRHEARIMKVHGVVGVGIGRKDGKDTIRIYVEKDLPKLRTKLPNSLESIPVEVVESGTFRAL